MSRMRIGELAKRLDLNPQTIRYYERIGLLPEPERTDSGYRMYGEEDEARLRFVKNARGVGLTLGEVREVLAFHERGEVPCSYVTEVIARRAEEVERRIAELTEFKARLDVLYERALERPAREPRPHGYCHIIEGERGAGRELSGVPRA
ncbi:MAG: heavy metal-responsive transcriptional regulator [Rubrobacteraceae bacterium]|uniref:heavy metal-responsive transcriptional regulator n=1 Tax=Rubrobacter naiadicus TaxID=1392641 RepID=UPI00235E856F|nr:heavy metal-responsive transcriptional regulator [Rubrobacter naiadicus]MBX6763592.1 heavy metal-responsive transcriptional regulator [Rubrobacteraceae bacterium]MCL6439349.1 heavy metal-responsive transcriptional regulator [Rubrobacteraceae bacterium]